MVREDDILQVEDARVETADGETVEVETAATPDSSATQESAPASEDLSTHIVDRFTAATLARSFGFSEDPTVAADLAKVYTRFSPVSLEERVSYIAGIQQLLLNLELSSTPAQFDTNEDAASLESVFRNRTGDKKDRSAVVQRIFRYILTELLREMDEMSESTWSEDVSFADTQAPLDRVLQAIYLLPQDDQLYIEKILTIRLSAENPKQSRTVSRRTLLKAMLGTAAASFVSHRALSEMLKALSATRPVQHLAGVAAGGQLEISPIPLDRVDISYDQVRELLGYSATQELSAVEQLEIEELSAVIIEYLDPLLLIMYANCDGTHRRDGFTQFRSQFLERIVQLAQEHRLRIADFIWLCGMSADNTSEEGKKNNLKSDVQIRQVQLGIGALAAVDQRAAAQIIELIGTPTPSGFSVKRGIQKFLSDELPGVMDFYDMIRYGWPVTGGPHDLEAVMYAKSKLALVGEELLAKESPLEHELFTRDTELYNLRRQILVCVEQFLQDISSYVTNRSDHADSEFEELLTLVGITRTGVEPLQKARATKVWEMLIRYSYGPRTRGDRPEKVAADLQRDCVAAYFNPPDGRQNGLLQLFSDQFVHPHFFTLFDAVMEKFEVPEKMHQAVRADLVRFRQIFLQQCAEYDAVDAQLSKRMFEQEKNLDMQTEWFLQPPLYYAQRVRSKLEGTGLVDTTADQLQPLEFLFACAIREIAPIPMLTSPRVSFGKTINADSPYAEDAIMDVFIAVLHSAKGRLQGLLGDVVDSEMLAVWLTSIISRDGMITLFHDYLDRRKISVPVDIAVELFDLHSTDAFYLQNVFSHEYSSLDRAYWMFAKLLSYIKRRGVAKQADQYQQTEHQEGDEQPPANSVIKH